MGNNRSLALQFALRSPYVAQRVGTGEPNLTPIPVTTAAKGPSYGGRIILGAAVSASSFLKGVATVLGSACQG